MSDAAPPPQNYGIYPWLRVGFGVAVYAGFVYAVATGQMSPAEGLGGGLFVAVLAWWALPWLVLLFAVMTSFSTTDR